MTSLNGHGSDDSNGHAGPDDYGGYADHADDLVAAYVLDAVSADEAARVRAHLETCAECRQLTRELGEVVAKLPALATEATPPPRLKARVMAAVTAEPRTARPDATFQLERAAPEQESGGLRQGANLTALPPRPAPDVAATGRTARRSRTVASARPRVFGLRTSPWMAVAAMLIAAVAIVALLRQLGTVQTQPTQQLALAGTPAMPSISGHLDYYQGSDDLTITLTGLKPVPSNRVYELWLIKKRNGKIVTANGIYAFQPRADGTYSHTLHGPDTTAYTLAGLTVERAPISAVPTLPMVAQSKAA